jgi:hypothetical protein
MIVAANGGTYDPQATSQIHTRVARTVPSCLGSGRRDLPDDTAYTVVRIPERDVGVARGVAGRCDGRGFVLFEELVQRDVDRKARLDRAPRPQIRKVTAAEHPPRLQELRRRMGPFPAAQPQRPPARSLGPM